MAYSPEGLNDALVGGIAQAGDLLSLHTADPGTTGAAEDAGVTALPANWGAPSGASVDSVEVSFDITAGGGQRIYTHFGVKRADLSWITGGPLDQSETYSDNGGTFLFTTTLASQNVA